MPGYAETPSFSVPAGAYTSVQTVEISVPQGATVRYTTDGSIPTAASPAYTGPITLSSGVTILRARAFAGGLFDSDVATASYFVNQGEATAENHVSTIPVISLVSDPDYLFGAVNGIYVAGQTYYEKSGGRDTPTSYTIQYDNNSDYFKYANFNAQHETHPDPMGMEWERPAHIDYIGTDGSLLYEEDMLCRIFGAFSRYDKQKGFALVSRAGYGSTSMDYAFFDNRPYTSFKTLTLRASAKDVIYTRMRDILIQGLLEDGGSILPTQAYVQVALYINGEYWGVYNLREKVNKYFIAQRYGLADPEEIDILVGNGVSPAAEIAGNGYLDYKALVEYAGSHDLSDPNNYAYVCSLMDVENFAEYCAMEIYVGNTDTGNIKFWRSSQLDNKWRWIPYDFDWAFNREDGSQSLNLTTGYRRDFFTKYFHPEGHGAGKGFSTTLSRALLQNSNFRALFLEKCALMLEIFAPRQDDRPHRRAGGQHQNGDGVRHRQVGHHPLRHVGDARGGSARLGQERAGVLPLLCAAVFQPVRRRDGGDLRPPEQPDGGELMAAAQRRGQGVRKPAGGRPYRHEQKYLISEGEYALLSRRLQMTMAQDAHAAQNGRRIPHPQPVFR